MPDSTFFKKIGILFALCFVLLTLRNVRNATSVSGFTGSEDFIWGSARAMLLHVDPYRESSEWIPIEKEKGIPLETFYAPSCVLLLCPFAEFHWATAKDLWLIFNLCMCLCIFVAIRRLWLNNISFNKYLLFVLLTYASVPWRLAISGGQQTIFTIGFFLLAYHQALAKRTFTAGILLSLSFMKYTLTAPLFLWMAFNGFASVVVLAVLIQCALMAFSCSWLGIQPLTLATEYINSARHTTFFNGPDIFPFTRAIFGGGDHKFFIAAFILCATSALLIRWRSKRRDPLLELALLANWSLLVVYHGGYDLCALVFALILLFRDKLASKWHALLAIALTELWFFQKIMEHMGLENHVALDNIVTFVGTLATFICLVFIPSMGAGVRDDVLPKRWHI